ncbi:uncharacterized protein LOC133285306 [Gastrolobium bilobum]|uniref:uncharacterized protein LOC133285306 n=1 Tax=Gastrolobium bilobum TaxID=150636 RepID=UPI002AAF96A5|nr:uncharacterized protein LOC133285306 [Gastrolobium bilobum]
MSEIWHSLKKSLHCKPHSLDVHDPMASGHHRSIKQGKIDSSKSQARNAILNPVTHEIVLDSSSGEIKMCVCCPYPLSSEDGEGVEGHHQRSTKRAISSRETHYVDCDECYIFLKPRVLVQKDCNGPPTLTCHQERGEKLKSLDTVEERDISGHSVIGLHKEDSSWQIIEKICQGSYVSSESKAAQIECVMKVQNTQKTFACFEECREMVKNINVERKQDKHPRCLVDGNELLRFHGTTVACSLGINGSSSLCTLDQCGVCQILRHGFSTNKELHGAVGAFTAFITGKAIDSIGSSHKPVLRESVIVCRVIAGRVYNPLLEIQGMTDSEFDSFVKTDIEELYVLNPRAVLPCFVVIFKF